MPQQVSNSVDNNFVKGLITEASGLNFPENACTETYDCLFNVNGTVSRRLGFDFEPSYSLKSINRENLAVSSFIWKNATGTGTVNLLVIQIGSSIYFWDTSGSSVSAGAIGTSISLTSFLASGAPAVDTVECQFSSSTQYLIVTHPYCEPFFVSYDPSTPTVTATQIDIKIRDFEGDSADSNAVDNRPTATLSGLDVHHKYNLYNQGWNTTNLTAWDTSQTTMPSNSDVMWRFKNTSDAFDTTTIPNVITGNSPAPKGHYILSAWDLDRDTASGLTGTSTSNSSYQRPSTSAFFAGRIFYSGVNSTGYNNKIYFTQILERDAQYGFCYQANDPTAEDVFDLLATDGGVIVIAEAGTIYKIVAVPGTLLIFANNGIWSISGSTGLGFTANDYTAQKISSVSTISASSFVDVGGLPAWWNIDGIYLLDMSSGAPSAKNITQTTIKTFYNTIPSTSIATAKGYYNPVDGIIQWLYKSTLSTDVTDTYTFDRILNFNVLTGAFYIWRIPTNIISINGMFISNTVSQSLTQYTVVNDSGDTVVDDSSDTVLSFDFDTGTSVSKTFKYISSYVNGSTYDFTFSEASSEAYLDWFTYDGIGVDYTSYLITGYKIRGEANKKFQSTWVNIYSNTDTDTKYYFRGIWDFANTSSTKRWSNESLITHSDSSYDYGNKRLKVRGHGKALQFRVGSYTGFPFNIIGWSTMSSVNTLP